ncbi:MAG: hypothetical protein ACPL06_00995 [Candidatus Anstonellales archaeon]
MRKIDLEVAAKAAVGRGNGRVPKLKELLDGLDLVDEKKHKVGLSLKNAGVNRLIRAINRLDAIYPNDLRAELDKIWGKSIDMNAETRSVVIGILEGVADLDKCNEVRKEIEEVVEAIKKDGRWMGISYYAPW